VVFLEAVSRPRATRSYRREGQEATLDDFEHQDQVGLPAAEVGAVWSTCSIIAIATVIAAARKRPPATPTRSRLRIPTATTTALVHHTRRNEIRYRSGNADEKMNGEASPYSGSHGNTTAIRAAK
jgi:hypothetical protein